MKMILHNKFFPVKFAKFLRVLILSKNICEGPLLQNLQAYHSRSWGGNATNVRDQYFY